MSLLLRINLWLVGTFLVFLTAAVLVSRLAMLDEARDDAISDARLLLESAQGARDYTTAEVEPLLVRPGGATPTKFFPQSVPAYAATQMFQTLRKKRPEFTYREATLNPTNPRDRTVAWEADVVEYFRNNAGAEELVNERQAELGRSLYLARESLEYFLSAQHWIDARDRVHEAHRPAVIGALAAALRVDHRPRDGQGSPPPMVKEPGAPTKPPAALVAWRQEQLSAMATRLATYIGPVAGVLVERASRRARDERELIEMLANEVDDRSARDRFIAEVRGRMERPAST